MRWWQLSLAGALALVLGLGALQVIALLARPLALLILAISIAAALAPVVAQLERWLPRAGAIALVYLMLILALVGIGQLIVPPLAGQAKKIADSAPQLISQAQQRLGFLGIDTSALLTTLTSQLGQFSSSLVALPLMLFSSLLEILLVLVMSLYWLFLARPLRDFVLSLFPEAGRARILSLLYSIEWAMGGYMRAILLTAVTIGILTYIGLVLIGVEFPVVLALLAGLLELVPIVGPIISGLLVTGVALLQSPTLAIIALVYMFLLQQFEGQILVPNMMRSQADVSPLLAILAIFAGSSIGGLLGALVAIPIVSILQVFVVELIAPAVRRWTGAEPASADKSAGTS